MRSKIIILLLLLLVVINFKLRANGNDVSGWINMSSEYARPLTQDSVRDEFNLKKKDTKVLAKGKAPEAILHYYQFYLQEKDESRADSLANDLLKRDSSVENKYKISLTSYFYTANSKTRTLFLSNAGRLKEYRAYFLKQGTSKLRSNIYRRAHYYNLVAIDSAYYCIAPDSLSKIQMANHYNSLAWYSLLMQKFNDVAYYLNQTTKYDPLSKYPISNLPLLLLLEKHYDKAKALYLKYKDQPFDKTYLTYKEVFLEDFKELEKEGLTNEDIKRITRLLNE